MKNLLILFYILVSLIGNKVYAENIITVDGSSTVFPITEAMAEEYQKIDTTTKITIGISGTGGGFKKFCNGENLNIVNASRKIKKTEIELCGKNKIQYKEIPIGYDGITIVVNKNSKIKNIKVEELKKIWEPNAQGKIMKWNQVRDEWPNNEIHLFGPGVDSGTYDYFTEVIVGKEHSSRGDFTASEDDNVLVNGVINDTNALGFFGYAYYKENMNKLNALSINGIFPSFKTIKDGTYKPLSRQLFIYVNKNIMDKKEIKKFINFYLTHPNLITEVGYVPLK